MNRTPSQILAVIATAFDLTAEADHLPCLADAEAVRARYRALCGGCVSAAVARHTALVEFLQACVVVPEPVLV